MPDWLPELLKVSPWGVPYTYNMLYSVFCRDIRNTHLRYEGRDVWFFKDMDDGKEVLFWHLTSREIKAQPIPRRKRHLYPPGQTHDPETTDRLPDPPRCERLNWVKPLVEHPSDPDVRAWDYEEGDGVIKTYVWIKDYDFLVVMKKFPDGTHRLITSFYVDEQNRQTYERKYENRIQ